MKKQNKKFDVIGIGSCAVDYIGVVSSFPAPDTKTKMKKMACQGGGVVATALVTLARLGASVSYLGKLGDDALSQFAINEFMSEGVDISNIIREKGAGPYFAFITADEKTGQRTIWWTDQDVAHLKPDEISKEVIASSRFLHLDEYEFEAALYAARLAKETGTKVVLDAESPQNMFLGDLIKLTDVLIVPEEFALPFTGTTSAGDAAGKLAGYGPQVISITQGKRGSYYTSEKGLQHQDAFEVEVADSTGCGDVYHGAFIYGLLQEWPVEITAEFACAVAAAKCRKLGGRSGIPTLPQAREFLMEKGSERLRQFLS